MKLQFAQSSRRHRIGRHRIRHAIDNALIVRVVDPPEDSWERDTRYLFSATTTLAERWR